MKWIITKNNKAIKLKSIPKLRMPILTDEIIYRIKEGNRVISYFGVQNNKNIDLYVVLADDENSRLLISSSQFTREKYYTSISKDIPSFYNFENEFYENFGIRPDKHPWLKPVRYGYDRVNKENTIENFPFFNMTGEEVHEVAVGPIHAGVIEPGHFRFMCQGENVHHLEIQLGYQHRGVENLFVESKRRFNEHLAESITGDTVIGHTTAYANAMESLANVAISEKAMIIRAIALEMERAAIHIGDLGALANDVAYLLGNSVYGATRTLMINSLLTICGSRFGRGLIRVGGVLYDINDDFKPQLIKTLKKIQKDIELISETMFTSPSVLSRFEQTGIVTNEIAARIGLVGLAAKASGIALDVRSDHPFGIYQNYPIHKISMHSGDVFARAYLRYAEIIQSINYIFELLEQLNSSTNLMNPIKKISGDSMVISMTEGWRGEIVHVAITDKSGGLLKYKIKDPSFNNWFGLAQAVRTNGISDFPLCNKSFNLSYCGYDL